MQSQQPNQSQSGGYPMQGHVQVPQQQNAQPPPQGLPSMMQAPPHQMAQGYAAYPHQGPYQSYPAPNSNSNAPAAHVGPPRPPLASIPSPQNGYPPSAGPMSDNYANQYAPSPLPHRPQAGYASPPPPLPPQAQGYNQMAPPMPPIHPATNAGAPAQQPYSHPPSHGYASGLQPPLPNPPSAPYAPSSGGSQMRSSFSGSQHYQPQPAPASKISSAQMPNVVAVREADQARFSAAGASSFFQSSMVSDVLPPLPTTKVPIFDDGNCSARFMRPTMYHLPASEDLAFSCKIPLAMVIQPFAKQHPQEHPVPVVDFGESGPLRCNRCRSYINLFVRFVRGGRQFECNICSMVNDVPDGYFCNLDASGRRADSNQRPELTCASIDFVASKEYIMRAPAPPLLLFAIDVSRNAVQNGAFYSSLGTIRRVIEDHIQAPNCHRYSKMAIVTFDKNIHVYDFRALEPQILVMSDIVDPFVPLHDGLFFDPVSAGEQVFALLDRLPSMFSESRIIDSCLGAVAAFSFEALKNRGGRAAIFHSTIPSIGVGLLRNRDSSSSPPVDKANPLCIPQVDFYAKLGSQAASHGVSFVLVSTPATYIDMATIGTDNLFAL